MPTFQVFHHDSEVDSTRAFSERAYQRWPRHYRRVAVVEASCPGEVFELTNHGVNEARPDWSRGDAVRLLDDPRPRSTSVGDVILDEQGRVYGVAGMGFADLGELRRCATCGKPVYDWEVGPDFAIGKWCRSCTEAGFERVGWGRRRKRG